MKKPSSRKMADPASVGPRPIVILLLIIAAMLLLGALSAAIKVFLLS